MHLLIFTIYLLPQPPNLSTYGNIFNAYKTRSSIRCPAEASLSPKAVRKGNNASVGYNTHDRRIIFTALIEACVQWPTRMTFRLVKLNSAPIKPQFATFGFRSRLTGSLCRKFWICVRYIIWWWGGLNLPYWWPRLTFLSMDIDCNGGAHTRNDHEDPNFVDVVIQ